MAYKVFTNGSPLPASDLNTYLMNQSVMVFANSTARSAALTSPTEGMVTYLEDVNELDIWTGAAWVDVNDNSNAIPRSTVTTAGDLIVGTGNAAVTRLGIGANGSIPRVASGALGYLAPGTNGQVLSISGGAPTWTTPAGGGDKVWTSLFSGSITTGSTTFTVGSLASYDSYLVRIQAVSTTSTSSGFTIHCNSSSSGNSLINLRFPVNGSNQLQAYAESDSGGCYLGQYASSASSSVNGVVLFTGGKGSTPAQVQYYGGTNGTGVAFSGSNSGMGIMPKSASISSITLTADANIDAGQMQIWGA